MDLLALIGYIDVVGIVSRYYPRKKFAVDKVHSVEHNSVCFCYVDQNC